MFEFSNRMTLPERQPYVGDLVFTAFSGSHQDAIKKGMADIYDVQPGEALEGEYDVWDVPYLPIDPRHLGRSYEAVIRVNSQSGKGGVAYVLLHEYGLDLPRQLQVDFAKKIQAVTEDTGTEITSYEIQRRFMSEYVEPTAPNVEIIGHRSSSDTLESGTTTIEAKLIVNGREQMVTGEGNGPIDAFVHALTTAGLFDGKIADYSEHTMGTGSDATAVAYVEVDSAARVRSLPPNVRPSSTIPISPPPRRAASARCSLPMMTATRSSIPRMTPPAVTCGARSTITRSPAPASGRTS